MSDFGLKKEERLSGSAADNIFVGCSRCYANPVRASYRYGEAESGLPSVRILVSVPKKLFKRAVKRNLLKRRIREAYRLNKLLLTEVAEAKSRRADVAFIYNSNEVFDYQTIENGVKRILAQIAERL